MSALSTRFQSSLSFIFAVAASAVGLGNIWRFPYLAGENGGGLFVIMYLVFVVLLGIPLLMSEMNVGRIGRGGPAQSMRVVATESDASTKGGALGGWMVISSFLILTCYVVASGWVLDYAIHSFSYGFSHMSEAAHSQLLNLVTKDPHQMLVISAQ